MDDNAFQVDLHGVVDLLANHLYSGPRVYVRELLQNGVDAIMARRQHDPGHDGHIAIELVGGDTPTVVVDDDGIGLDAVEVREFLSTIGRSSKRDELSFARSDFIGQFGVGLLSAFIVSDEVVVTTTSAVRDQPTVEWHGRADGTYSLREIDERRRPGTTVHLRARRDTEQWFEPDTLVELARFYGEFLPVRIEITGGIEPTLVTSERVPWELDVSFGLTPDAAEVGRSLLGFDPLDALPLDAPVGGARGIAFVLPHSPSPTAHARHRVYIKRMLLSDHCDSILPEWAFFVAAVVNATELVPTASREELHDDESLQLTRASLGDSMRDALVRLANTDASRLTRIVNVHHVAMKALAAQDDDFLAVIGDWLPFQTNSGILTLREIRERFQPVHFARDDDSFRQIAQVAAALDLGVVNGGLLYDAEVIERAGHVFDGLDVREIEPDGVIRELATVEAQERVRFDRLLRAANDSLAPFGCTVELRRFEPWSLPDLYTASDQARFLRSLDQTRDAAAPLYASILDSVERGEPGDTPTFCFNAENPLVERLAAATDPVVLERGVELLYIQSLLLGHHPLRTAELAILNGSLLGLLDWAARHAGGGLGPQGGQPGA